MKIIRAYPKRLRRKLNRDGVIATLLAIFKFPLTLPERIAYKNMLKLKSAEQKFSKIYQKNLWKSAESGSGEGSEIAYTERLRNWLVTTIPKYNIQTFVDAPCGDFNWMRLVLPQVNVEYFGFDIVGNVIDVNKRKFSSSKIHFDVANICEDKLPSCDLLMVRDCLFHLSYDDINRFLKNISYLDYQYLLTTTHIVDSTFKNSDIITGDFRLIDLFGAPFKFNRNKVVAQVDDYPLGHSQPRKMILTAKTDVPKKIERFS